MWIKKEGLNVSVPVRRLLIIISISFFLSVPLAWSENINTETPEANTSAVQLALKSKGLVRALSMVLRAQLHVGQFQNFSKPWGCQPPVNSTTGHSRFCSRQYPLSLYSLSRFAGSVRVQIKGKIERDLMTYRLVTSDLVLIE